jgi:predicted GNAT superfamily acetyltransferase
MKYIIRECNKIAEFLQILPCQQAIWGYSDLEAYPLRLFVNLRNTGGSVLGAFTPKNELAGYVLSMPAWNDHGRYYHSIALGVKKEHENHGLGKALKLAQRKTALAQGIELIKWSFDPLRAKNAYLNIVRLGAVIRRFEPNFYGPVDSELQRGLPSDRLIGEWHLKSSRVRRALAGKPIRNAHKKPAAEIAVPANFESLLRLNREYAIALQRFIAAEFTKHFHSGLQVTWLEQNKKETRYILDPYED